MSVWHKEVTTEMIEKMGKDTIAEHLDIRITNVGEDSLEGTMPVDKRTKQPYGILHGGANCVLAETLGSLASNLIVDYEKEHAVGVSINTSHIKSTRNGRVRGIAKPIHLGRQTHVWDIKTYYDADQLTSSTTLTMMIIPRLGK